MTGRGRQIPQGSIIHCYQRSLDGFILFYTVSDCLVFYSLVCLAARRNGIRILKLCLMVEHYHLVVAAPSLEALTEFIRYFTSGFAKAQNREMGRSGPLFESPFGCAVKRKEKEIRSALIYVDNNPVERFICGQAEQYRWNFLAYSGSEHPFSQPIIRYRASKYLRQALEAIDTLVSSEKPLNYQFLYYQFRNLGQEEKNAVTDYIISRFNEIDYDAAFRYFGGYGNALTAIHATTGSDYEIKESFSGRDDRVYSKIAVLARKLTGIQDIHQIIAMPLPERQELMKKVSEIVVAVPVEQIARYFRMPIKS